MVSAHISWLLPYDVGCTDAHCLGLRSGASSHISLTFSSCQLYPLNTYFSCFCCCPSSPLSRSHLGKASSLGGFSAQDPSSVLSPVLFILKSTLTCQMLSLTPLPMAVVQDVCLTSHLGAHMGEGEILLEATWASAALHTCPRPSRGGSWLQFRSHGLRNKIQEVFPVNRWGLSQTGPRVFSSISWHAVDHLTDSPNT